MCEHALQEHRALWAQQRKAEHAKGNPCGQAWARREGDKAAQRVERKGPAQGERNDPGQRQKSPPRLSLLPVGDNT